MSEQKTIKLPDSELKVMDVLWEHGEFSAKATAEEIAKRYGWKKNTTYTILKNLKEKGVLDRIEPGFIFKPLIGREQVGRMEARNVLERFYKGSAAALFSAFMKDKAISDEDLEEIRQMIDQSK